MIPRGRYLSLIFQIVFLTSSNIYDLLEKRVYHLLNRVSDFISLRKYSRTFTNPDFDIWICVTLWSTRGTAF